MRRRASPAILVKMAARRPPCLAGQYSPEKVAELHTLSPPCPSIDDLWHGFA
jgi:hypothetical protein